MRSTDFRDLEAADLLALVRLDDDGAPAASAAHQHDLSHPLTRDPAGPLTQVSDRQQGEVTAPAPSRADNHEPVAALPGVT